MVLTHKYYNGKIPAVTQLTADKEALDTLQQTPKVLETSLERFVLEKPSGVDEFILCGQQIFGRPRT